MPSSNPWLRPAGRLANMTPLKVIPNGYLCGLLKLQLSLSSLVHQSVTLLHTTLSSKLLTLTWDDQNCLELHTTSVPLVHGELVMQFMV